jgi:hypothetical protein
MSLTPICRRRLGTQSVSCRNIRAYVCFLPVAAALIFSGSNAIAYTHEGIHYPEAVLRLMAGRQPFAPVNSEIPHTFALRPLRETHTRKIYGAGIRMGIESLGQKLFLVDTAARGLLLKSRPEKAKNSVCSPDWIRPGPGIQTGIFRLFPGISNGEFSLKTAVVELFWEKGFRWIDGILSTEILAPWIVRLDFPRMKMNLIPRKTYSERFEWTLPATLDVNWWIVPVTILDKPALMLLDSGASHTYVSEQWLRKNLPPAFSANRKNNWGSAFFEAGMCEISLKGANVTRRMVLGAADNQIPHMQDFSIDGVLAFDVLQNLAIDLDYRAQKLYLHHES